MLNGFFGLSTRYLQRPRTVATGASTEALADIGNNGLRRIAHLADVQQPLRRTIDEPIDSIHRALSGVEDSEIAVRRTAQSRARSRPPVTKSAPSKPFSLRLASPQTMPPLGLQRSQDCSAVRNSAPLGTQRP